MKIKLQDILWKFGFKALLIGFCFLISLIFCFFFFELTDLYTQITNYSIKIRTMSQEFITEKQKNIQELTHNVCREIQPILDNHNKIAKYTLTDNTDLQYINSLKTNLTIQLNKALQEQCKKHNLDNAYVFTEYGAIIAQYGSKYDFIAPQSIQQLLQTNNLQTLGITEKGIHLTMQIPVEDFKSFIMIYKTTNMHPFQSFLQFDKIYKLATNFKIYIYALFIFIFVLLISVFLFYSMYITRRITRIISKNLNPLMNIAKIVELKQQIDIIPNVEILEFQEIINILSTSLNNIHKSNTDLQEKNAFIKEMLDNIANGIILLNSDNTIILMNATLFNLLQLPLNTDFSLMQHLPIALSLLNNAKEKGQNIIQQIDYKAKRLMCKVIIYNDKILLSFEDISSQISLQKQIAWRDVARVIAHEVKNPLTPTRLYAEHMLHDNTLSQEKKEKYLTAIVQNVEHVSKLIDDFTDFTKHTQQIINIKNLSLNVLLQNIIEAQELIYKNVTYTLITNSDDTIQADEKQLKQALLNLIQNASQAFNKNQTDANVHIEYKKTNTHVNIYIKDNGDGIDANKIEQLFQPYMTTKSYGTGLGLIIVRKIAQAHGGTIELLPQEKGITAVLSLPL